MQIESSLLSPVAAWAAANYHTFKVNPVSPGRQFEILQRTDLNPPPEVWEIKQLIVDEFGLAGAPIEPVLKDYCSVITEGGAIHMHTDRNQGDKIHTRFNVMVAKPDGGGMPVHGGTEIDLAEGQVWRCDAGIVEHGSTPVVGPNPRIVLSYGFLL